VARKQSVKELGPVDVKPLSLRARRAAKLSTVSQSRPDELDVRLIRELQADSRQTTTMLAESLGVSEPTVRRRMNYLKNNEMVKFTVIINPERLGLPVSATLLFSVDPSKVDEISDRLSKFDEFYSVIVTTGNYDIVVSGYFTSVDAIYEILKNDINTIDGVNSVNTMVVLKRKKRAY
jgi:DNA-binding Lrp family transcriptional regulator